MLSRTLGAEVYYKLRATAVRSSTFAPNFHAVKPVFVIKAFSYESLEYNQSLEVEVRRYVPAECEEYGRLTKRLSFSTEHMAWQDHVQHHDPAQGVCSRGRYTCPTSVHAHSKRRVRSVGRDGTDRVCPCAMAQNGHQ